MANREAHARPASEGVEAPATLISTAEEHARALRKQLLKSTELAARELVGQTRAEGERRIEEAGRRAQAIAATVAQIEEAERALADRANAFADASKSLRAELESFAAVLSAGEERLTPQPVEEPELRLVASPAPKRARPEPPPAGVGQFPFTADVDDAEAELDEGEPNERFDGEVNAEEDDEDEDEDEPDEDEPPTPEEIARFFRETEAPDLARAARREASQAPESLRERLRQFFNGPIAEETPEEASRPRATVDEGGARRSPARNRLYTDIGGAVIGLGGAAALLNFVLID